VGNFIIVNAQQAGIIYSYETTKENLFKLMHLYGSVYILIICLCASSTVHFKYSHWMLYGANIANVINCILVSLKIGVQIPWGWHRFAETCRSGQRPYLVYICDFVHWLGFINECQAKCMEWITSQSCLNIN